MSRRAQQGFWQRTLWFLLYPARRHHRAEATVSGTVLIVVSVGIGMAAYNASNNILFITLALLLSSLLVSGLLSWLNLRSVRVTLHVFRTSRAAEPAFAEVRVSNARRFLPAVGFWFEMKAEPEGVLGVPEALQRERRRGFARRLALAEALVLQGRLPLRGALPPGEASQLEWTWIPPRRGRWLVQVGGLGSLFPFGFLRKFMYLGLEQSVVVRPENIGYQVLDAVGFRGLSGDHRQGRKGDGVDLFALRTYREGDSHRSVHWKASARMRRLVVRETVAESGPAYVLQFEPFADLWGSENALERGVRLAARLAEDLFTHGHLRALWLGGEAPVSVRGEADVEAWLDRLSCVSLSARSGETGQPPRVGRLLTIKPEGPNGAAAYAEGRRIIVA